MDVKNTNKTEYLLFAEKIEKRYGGVFALKNGEIAIKSGEIHGLVGENGAGKSTLINIIMGMTLSDSGSIYISGEKKEIKTPIQARREGIEIVLQELNLQEDMTVAENIVMSSLAGNKKLRYRKDKIENMVQKFMDNVPLGQNINAGSLVSELSSVNKQLVQIYRGLFCFTNNQDSKIIIFDEPTAALTIHESNRLHSFMKKLAVQNNKGVLYVSHRLADVIDVCDRITVFRDGNYVTTLDSCDVDLRKLSSYMIGRNVNFENEYLKCHRKDDAVPALEVRGLCSKKGKFGPIDLKVYPGEIVGISGLVGARRSSLLKSIFGLVEIDSGEILLNGQKVTINGSAKAIKNGIGFIPEERKTEGLILGMSIKDNIMIPYSVKEKGLGVSIRKEKEKVQEQVETLSIKTPDISNGVSSLSGGNQQKVVISKWMQTDCDIFLMDEPTKGVDVGSKNEIYSLLSTLAERGKAILVVSSELEEIIKISDRILVMCEGRVVREREKGCSQTTLLNDAFKIEQLENVL